MNARSLLLVAASSLLLIACTGSPPEVLSVDSRLSALQDPSDGTVSEVLRLYVAVHDPDGTDDPARITVSNDASQLAWTFEREAWVEVDYANDTWYGMPDLRMPDRAPFPRGVYRVVVEDAALSSSEQTFALGGNGVDAGAVFPQLVADGSSWRVRFTEPVELAAYTRAGTLAIDRTVSPGVVPEEIRRAIPDDPGVEIYLTVIEDGVRRESGPFSAPR